jgi:hypothetical protein
MRAVSGTNGLAGIIPTSLSLRIEQWAQSRMTGQISLNFNQGRVLSYDTREHGVIPGRCSKCMAEREIDDRNWTIVRGQAFCGICSPL